MGLPPNQYPLNGRSVGSQFAHLTTALGQVSSFYIGLVRRSWQLGGNEFICNFAIEIATFHRFRNLRPLLGNERDVSDRRHGLRLLQI
jgi:hypothetical protein